MVLFAFLSAARGAKEGSISACLSALRRRRAQYGPGDATPPTSRPGRAVRPRRAPSLCALASPQPRHYDDAAVLLRPRLAPALYMGSSLVFLLLTQSAPHSLLLLERLRSSPRRQVAPCRAAVWPGVSETPLDRGRMVASQGQAGKPVASSFRCAALFCLRRISPLVGLVRGGRGEGLLPEQPRGGGLGHGWLAWGSTPVFAFRAFLFAPLSWRQGRPFGSNYNS